MATKTTWGIDISNWDGTVTAQNIADWVAAQVGVCMIRGSEESAALTAIATQQFQAVQPSVKTVFPYLWCYGSDTPEAIVGQTLKDFGGLCTEKKLAFDVEDIVNFVTHATTVGLKATDIRRGGRTESSGLVFPKRYMATIEALKTSQGKFGFSSLSPTLAVQWLTRAFAETVKNGFEPVIYSASWCWNPMTNSFAGFSNMKWMVAQFDDIADLTIYNPVGGVQAIMAKQYTDAGTIPLNDPNAPTYDFSIYDASMLITTPVPPTPPSGTSITIDLSVLQSVMDRATNIRSEIAPLIPLVPVVSTADGELDNIQQDVRFPGVQG